jgi:methylated-DNA-[protein]-cysteine S-methyltransferase
LLADRYAHYEAPFGVLTIVGRARRLSRLSLTRHDLTATHGPPEPDAVAPILAQLRGYFAGDRQVFDLDLAPEGTPFQRRVWCGLGLIPFGETRSYAWLARQLHPPSVARAVGQANGANPIAIVVPCHRVIGADGSLVGFGGGLPTKRWLLAHESRQITGP